MSRYIVIFVLLLISSPATLILAATPVFLILAATPAMADYSAVIDDLPLMPGMTEKADEALVFDKPNGRIVEIGAEVSASAREVLNFYSSALPPLGWRALSSTRFARNDEMLDITVEPQGGITLVHFNLTPKGN